MDTQDIIALGGLAGAFIAIGRLFFMIRAGGASDQKRDDDIEALKVEQKENREFRTKMYQRTDEIKEMIGKEFREVRQEINNMKVESAKAHGEINNRITRLEASGCQPAKLK